MSNRCAAYLDALPDGFASFPDAEGLFDAFTPMLDRLDIGSNTATLRLTHPAGLFRPLIHRAYAEAFRAAGVVTRANDVTIACKSTESTAAFEVSYRR